jgi:hypothetical protein
LDRIVKVEHSTTSTYLPLPKEICIPVDGHPWITMVMKTEKKASWMFVTAKALLGCFDELSRELVE